MIQRGDPESGGLGVYHDALREAETRLEGRDPELQALIGKLADSKLGVSIYWMQDSEDGAPLYPAMSGQLIGYALPFDDRPNRVQVIFDNLHTYTLRTPDEDDPEAAAAFQRMFQPGSSPIFALGNTFDTAEYNFFDNLPYDKEQVVTNTRPSDCEATIEAISEVVRNAKQLYRERESAIARTGRILVDSLRELQAE